MEAQTVYTEYLLHIESTWEQDGTRLRKFFQSKPFRRRRKKNKKRNTGQREAHTFNSVNRTVISPENDIQEIRDKKTSTTDERLITHNVCHKRFDDSGWDRLIRDTEENMDQCSSSKEVSNSSVDLFAHMETYIGEKLHKCEQCAKGFRVRRNLIDHMRTHTCYKDTQATQVNLHDKLASYESTVSPINMVSNSNSSMLDVKPEELIRCSWCGMEFVEEREYESHKRTHRAGKSYSCTVCNETFVNKLSFLYHTLNHTDGEPRKCHVCDLQFTDEADLQRHRRAHRTGKTFTCTVCDKVFVHKLAFLYHGMEHKDNAPHKCIYCDKEFAEYEDLSKHSRTHRQSKSYKCNVCSELFCKKLDLLYHTIEHTNPLCAS